MKVQDTERERALEGRVEDLGGDGWRRRTALKRGGSRLLKLAMLVVLIAAGAWALRANLKPDRPAMDMSMRVTSGNTPFPVSTAPVDRGTIVGKVVYTGSVAPFNEEDVFPRVAGRIVEMPVYPGDAVRPGQVVARLDDVELSSRVREAESGAVAAAATAAQMEADVTAARHEITQMERELTVATDEARAARDSVAQMESEVAMVEADAEHQGHLIVRDERLYASGGISLQDLEATRAAVTAARAKVSAARAKVSQMKAMVSAAEAKVDAARARLDRAKAMEQSALRRREAMAAMAAQSQAMQRTAEVVRDYVTIRSPSGGYVVKRLVAPGVLVQPGVAILKIAQIDRVRLQANVGEKDVASIQVGSPVTVTTTVPGQPPITARVTSVFPFVDQGPRTAVVEAVVDNAGRRFLPGQYVTMEFVTGERSGALTVPVRAVTRMGGKATVWVVKDGRAEPLPVTTGIEGPERVEISQGLRGDERVIVRGHEGLYAGTRVSDVGAASGSPSQSGSDTTMPAMPGMKHGGEPPAPVKDATGDMPGMTHGSHAPAQPQNAMPDMPGMPGTKGGEPPAKAKEGGHAGHSGH